MKICCDIRRTFTRFLQSGVVIHPDDVTYAPNSIRIGCTTLHSQYSDNEFPTMNSKQCVACALVVSKVTALRDSTSHWSHNAHEQCTASFVLIFERISRVQDFKTLTWVHTWKSVGPQIINGGTIIVHIFCPPRWRCGLVGAEHNFRVPTKPVMKPVKIDEHEIIYPSPRSLNELLYIIHAQQEWAII